MFFSEKKFLDLPRKQQHKKALELLKLIYGDPKTVFLDMYQKMQHWLDLNRIDLFSKEAISNRFHFHLKEAELSLREPRLLPKVKTQDRLTVDRTPLPISIYLDHIRSAHNVGSIIRTTEAFSLGELVFSSQTPCIDQKPVADAAMGTSQWIKSRHTDLSLLPRPIIALETIENATSLYEFSFPQSFTLVLGNEEYGCSQEALQLADEYIQIPLAGRKNSLNVACAFAVAASEIVRQYKKNREDNKPDPVTHTW